MTETSRAAAYAAIFFNILLVTMDGCGWTTIDLPCETTLHNLAVVSMRVVHSYTGEILLKNKGHHNTL